MKRLFLLFFTVFAAAVAYGQAYQVKGVVQDELGPVIGATVLESNTMNGTTTDVDGHFVLNVKPGASIEISSIGYKTQVIAIGERTVFNSAIE